MKTLRLFEHSAESKVFGYLSNQNDYEYGLVVYNAKFFSKFVCHRCKNWICGKFSCLLIHFLQFIGATMGSAGLQIQTDNGQIGMPSNLCCVVVEYCPGGTLKSYLIKNRRRKLAFKVVVQLALDLARGFDL